MYQLKENKCNSVEDVDIGFAEECEPWTVTNRYFPSKIGGKPAWLSLKDLPSIDEFICPLCSEPRIFLCQVYAPLEDNESCFHRTIFIFVCKNARCYELNSNKNMVVFRSQLPHENEFYSAEAPDESIKLPEIKCLTNLCIVCGIPGKWACGSCKQVHYCSKLHQKFDWKYHKINCKKDLNKQDECTLSTQELLFPEYEIVSEIETLENQNTTDSISSDTDFDQSTEVQKIKKYEELLSANKIAGDLKDIPESELMEFVPENKEDKIFDKFRKRVSYNPKQVLRYNRYGEPLWICTDIQLQNQLKENYNEIVPSCENCGEKRIFEFQIMPQLLNFLNNDDIDWGILAVYTCSKSCETNSKYLKEFLLKQDIIPTESS